MISPAQRLRELLAAPGIQVMPCCFDALSAQLIAAAGFKVSFMSGFAVSAARLGLPDTGLISFGEMVDRLRNCCAAARQDAGDRRRRHRLRQRAQRAAHRRRIRARGRGLRDDRGPGRPKKCGHTSGKQVVSREEARMKIRAAVDAARRRRHPDHGAHRRARRRTASTRRWRAARISRPRAPTSSSSRRRRARTRCAASARR